MSSPSPPPADTTPASAPGLPPSISPEKLLAGETYTYTSPVPSEIRANSKAPVILGVDEAGRGPVLGPMVYAAAYCLESYSDTIKELGFADSKKLTHATRTALLTSLTTSSSSVPPSDPPNLTSTLPRNLGWTTTLLSPQTISTSMLRPPTQPPLNLNALAHNTTISLIRTLLSPPYSLNLTSIYIDTVGPPQSYTTLLQKHFPALKITVTKQADSIYPIVSAASVCAKVTRDVAIDVLTTPPTHTTTSPQQAEPPQPLGSGYPGDAKTISYLKSTLDPVFGWRGEVVRFSWATAKDLLDKDQRAVKAEWAEEGSDEGQVITSFFSSGKDEGVEKGVAGWYGRSVGVGEF